MKEAIRLLKEEAKKANEEFLRLSTEQFPNAMTTQNTRLAFEKSQWFSLAANFLKAKSLGR